MHFPIKIHQVVRIMSRIQVYFSDCYLLLSLYPKYNKYITVSVTTQKLIYNLIDTVCMFIGTWMENVQ